MILDSRGSRNPSFPRIAAKPQYASRGTLRALVPSQAGRASAVQTTSDKGSFLENSVSRVSLDDIYRKLLLGRGS